MMDDLTITKLCAEAMGVPVIRYPVTSEQTRWQHNGAYYDPLRDDAQAMALVKRFRISIIPDVAAHDDPLAWWRASSYELGYEPIQRLSLNQAICECVAQMQQAKN